MKIQQRVFFLFFFAFCFCTDEGLGSAKGFKELNEKDLDDIPFSRGGKRLLKTLISVPDANTPLHKSGESHRIVPNHALNYLILIDSTHACI